MLDNSFYFQFPPSNVIMGKAVFLSPPEMWRIEGKTIEGNRMFLLVCEGSIEVEVDSHPHVLQKGTFVDMFDKTLFRFLSVDKGCRAYCLIPSVEFVADSLKSFRVYDDRYLCKCLECPIIQMSDFNQDILERQMNLLESSFHAVNHAFRTELAMTYFKSFQIELANIIRKIGNDLFDDSKSFGRQDIVAMNFMKLVWEHCAEEHKLDFYADKLCLSTKHLTRIVKVKMGITPHEAIVNELVRKASDMLAKEDFPVSLIASLLNFSDQASFCKFFKQAKGVSPMEYRKMAK